MEGRCRDPGLGRTNRTNQLQPPLFRPIATNVKAEKRFLSTIARRLDTLGAITRGQRANGGQGLFRPEDNLESDYARDALRRLYLLIFAGKLPDCSLQAFENSTGLKLTDDNGIKDDLPPITTFLNRLLALTIDLQNTLFDRRAAAHSAYRRRNCVRHVRCRSGDIGGRELRRHRPALDLYPPGDGRRDPPADDCAADTQHTDDACVRTSASRRSPCGAADQ